MQRTDLTSLVLMQNCKTLFLVLALFAATSSLGAGDGAKLYNQFVDDDLLYADDDWQEYMDDLGRKLLRYSSDRNGKYYFFIIDSPVLNAFATMDAYIYVNRGLLLFLESEDQFASVVAHEIGHVVARHGARQKNTNLLGRGVGLAAYALTGRHEMMQLSNAATKALIAGYGREMELEADRIGAEMMAKAGYNPYAVIESLQVLKDQSLFAKQVAGQPANYHGLFASHPQHDKRLHDIVQYAQRHVPERATRPVRNYWEMLEGLHWGSEANIGKLANNIFFDKVLKVVIEFPRGYLVGFNNQEVTGIHISGEEIAWIRVTRHTPESRVDPSEFVKKTLKREDVVSESTIKVNDNDAYLAELSIENSDNKASLLGILYHGRDLYSFRGVAGTGADEEQFRKDFEAVLTGLRDLKPTDIKNDTRTRIKVITANPGDSYEKLAANSPINTHPVEMLRLMNGDYPTSEPRPGDQIKIVQ